MAVTEPNGSPEQREPSDGSLVLPPTGAGQSVRRDTGRRHRVAIVLIVVIAVAVFVLDQSAKAWVVANLAFGVPHQIFGTLLIFDYVQNPGAAFSLATGSTWVFSIIAAAVVVFLVWFARRIRSIGWAVLFGLLLGGTLGNLNDRLTRPPGFGVGHVVDFIQIPLLPAIFNLADSAIVSSMCLFIILTLLGITLDGASRRSGSRHQRATSAASDRA